MDSAANFPPLQQRLTSSLVQVTRTVGQLSAEDLNFHRSSSSEVSESLDEQSGRILSLTSSLLKVATAGADIPASVLSDEDSIEDNWRGIVDVIDALLEKADACLDEFTGVIKKLSPSLQEQEQETPAGKAPKSSFPTIYDYGRSKIPKPQLHFEHRVDTMDTSSFKPLLRTKPHAIEPLEKSLTITNPDFGYCNPYEVEIRAAKYPPAAYVESPPIDYQPFESTTATFVDTMDGVMEMLAELKSAPEIAIDLEHHDVHSYHGLVSLMQISTRDKDWVVDTLKPWREELQMLNEVFADPNILKLFHGSTMDIIWLQRDLGLYVVGMFDTYHAACALGYPKRSLKYLLQKFVNFEADKRYQMADWRVRPLPSGMFDYARSDTHYLLYIYDNLRNELLEQSTGTNNLIDYVQERSKNEALQRYERPVYDASTGQGAGGWYDSMTRNPAVFGKEQFAVFKAVHQWRDHVAREEDEGVQCVFPKHVLFRVAQAIPMDKGMLFRTLSPVTPITKDRVPDLLEVIKKAKAEGATGPEWRDVYVKPTRTHSNLAGSTAAENPQGLPTPITTQETNLPTAARYDVSQFWGAVLEPQEALPPPKYSAVASAEALRLSLPLPPMPRTVSEAHNKLNQPPKPSQLTPVPKEEKEQNKTFTVKELGGPRKRKSADAADTHSPSFELDLLQTEDSTKPSKKQRRKDKKKNKSPTETPQTEQPEQDTIPFNYDAADSVLNANPAQSVSRLPKKRPFNPYAKALEAPSGVRKEKRELPGKSFTFR